MALDERKLRVLNAVVQDYVQTAEPVSSRTIVKKYQLGVSPATIRNEMSDLEELGYLEQPHTSAGRVPSDKGYRLYVDELMLVRRASAMEAKSLSEAVRRRAEHVENLLTMAARVLSDMTKYLTVVTGPSPQMARFRALYMHLISSGKALAVVLTDIGRVENAIVDVPIDADEDDLRMISEVITSRLAGVPLDKIGQAAWRELSSELASYRSILEQILEVARIWPGEEAETGLTFDGALNIMSQPEFHDIEKVKLVLSALEEHTDLAAMLKAADPSKVSVAIGSETGVPQIRDCSLVWTTFVSSGMVLGSIGVLGPRRMDYAKVMALISYAKVHIAEAISRNVG